MNRRLDNDRTIRAPRGSEISAKSWLTEAPLRMLMNNLDPDVAERPSELVVYGGIGRAARDWDSFDRIVTSLRKLEGDQTLVVQSGKPVGIFRTHADAPRVLIANSNLVPHWATLDHFNELDRQGLMMFGQMTAGSWIYIGSQGIVQGTYETFVEVGRRHYGGSLAGKWILTAGLGGMGGAQPLAATMAGASMLAIECQPSRIEMRLRTGYLDRQAGTLDEALAIMAQAAREQANRSRSACSAMPPIFFPNWCAAASGRTSSPTRPARTIRSTVTCRRDGHSPSGSQKRSADPKAVEAAAKTSMVGHVQAMLDFHAQGIPTLDYGNNIRQMAKDMGLKNAFDFPGFVPAYIRPLFCRGVGPFRWAALSGDPEDIFRTDAKVKELMPDDKHLHNWLDMARGADQVPGAAGADLLGRPWRSPPAGPGVQRNGGARRTEGADRHRPRSSRQRLGGEPEPRNRSDARRLGRGVRLAAAQCAAQLRQRGDVGLAASRRRRRDRLFAARRHGDCRRRNAGGCAPYRAGALERSGDGGHASCRCGL